MARDICLKCQRPQKACICHCVYAVETPLNIAFLQHPSEVKETKGTAWLAHMCLTHSQFWVGEVFEDEHPLWHWLKAFNHVSILYPQTEGFQGAIVEAAHLPTHSAVLIVDGTWRKTRKMLYLNPRLTELSRVQIHPETPSEYQIRKEPSAQSLSTMEASAQLLKEYGDVQASNHLKHSFKEFIAFQKQFWPIS